MEVVLPHLVLEGGQVFRHVPQGCLGRGPAGDGRAHLEVVQPVRVGVVGVLFQHGVHALVPELLHQLLEAFIRHGLCPP